MLYGVSLELHLIDETDDERLEVYWVHNGSLGRAATLGGPFADVDSYASIAVAYHWGRQARRCVRYLPRCGAAASKNPGLAGARHDVRSTVRSLVCAVSHRSYCEWTIIRDDEHENPELTVERLARVNLRWTTSERAGQWFAELFRIDHYVWDAWLYPKGTRTRQPRRLTRNGTSYEMALMAIYRAMGDVRLESGR